MAIDTTNHDGIIGDRNRDSMADPTWVEEVHGYYGPVAASRRPFI